MVAADLHVHTTNSDGRLDLPGVLAAARSAALTAIAVTDHDRLHPALDAPVDCWDALTVVHGVELRVEAGDQRLDLLGYGVRSTAGLVAELDRIQADRMERGRAMVAGLEAELGIDLEVAIEPGLGRPAVARAVATHPQTDLDSQDVFDEYIADEAPLYVARDVPTFDRGRAVLAAACDLVALAHPLRYDDPEDALERATALDAVELHYPYAADPDLAPVRRTADRHDLLVTGGSDAHDDAVGSVGLGPAGWSRVRERLG